MTATQRRQLAPAVVAAWLGYTALDFFVHGALLAPWWRATADFWLPVRELFQRIPYAYASFAIYCSVLVWLLERVHGREVRVRGGAQLGAVAGFVYGTATVLAVYSVVRMPASAFAVWPGSAVAESALAGAVAAWVLGAARPWRKVGLVGVGFVVVVVMAVLLQNLIPGAHVVAPEATPN